MDTSLLPLLYVEDDALISLAGMEILEGAGFEVMHEFDGNAAIQTLDRCAGQFAALVTDVRLPGANGWKIARHARELNSRLCVVYMSGDSGAEWDQEGVKGSIFLQKPFSNTQLTHAILALQDDEAESRPVIERVDLRRH